MNARHNRIGENLGDFRAGPPTSERLYRLFHANGSGRPKALTDKAKLAAPAQQIAAQEIEHSRRETPQPATQEEIAILAGRFAGGGEVVDPSPGPAERHRGRLCV